MADGNVRRKRRRSPNGQPRQAVVTARVHQSSSDAIDARAALENETRSDFIRRALAFALREMPQGWTP